jgi:hypothetical protein
MLRQPLLSPHPSVCNEDIDWGRQLEEASHLLFDQDIYEAHIGEQPEIVPRYYHQ